MKAVRHILLALYGGIFFAPALYAAELGGDYTTLLCPQSLNIPDRPYVDAELDSGDTHMAADEADLIDGGVSIDRKSVV